ncbi:hypothetical protein PYCC9005_000729 [Savitreella phatthalungensis]
MDPSSPQMRPRTHGSVANTDPRASRSIHIHFDEERVNQMHRLDSNVFHTFEQDTGDQILQKRNRSFSISQNSELQDTLHETGREPGVDLNAIELDIHQECNITVTDYCTSRYEVHGPFDNEQFLQFMNIPQPDWSSVRWINVNGMDYNVLRRISNAYRFHQLSIEDSLHFPTRTKIDRYAEHAYLCLPLLLLLDDQNERDEEDDEETFLRFVGHALFGSTGAKNGNRRITNLYRNSEYQTTLREYYYPRSNFNRSVLNNSEVGVEQTSIFFTDRVVVSIFEHSASIIAAPVMKRIVAGSSLVLRTSESVEQLVHAIVDCIVDQHELVIAAFQEHLAELEYTVLETPKRDGPKELHMLKADISLLRRTVVHILAVVNDFRNNAGGSDKSARPSRRTFHPSALDESHEPLHQMAEDFSHNESTGTGNGSASIPSGQGFSGHSQIYLKNNRGSYWADVRDHLLSNMDHIDSMVSLCDTLANHIFQFRSSRQNDIMRQLTTTTIIFLPLTFMTGYFGMNFKGTWGALDDGPLYFWAIAIPVTVVLLVVVSLAPILRILRLISTYQERKRARDLLYKARLPRASVAGNSRQTTGKRRVRLFKRANTMNSATREKTETSQTTGSESPQSSASSSALTEVKRQALRQHDLGPAAAIATRSDSISSAERAIAAAASQHTNQIHHSQLYQPPPGMALQGSVPLLSRPGLKRPASTRSMPVTSASNPPLISTRSRTPQAMSTSTPTTTNPPQQINPRAATVRIDPSLATIALPRNRALEPSSLRREAAVEPPITSGDISPGQELPSFNVDLGAPALELKREAMQVSAAQNKAGLVAQRSTGLDGAAASRG